MSDKEAGVTADVGQAHQHDQASATAKANAVRDCAIVAPEVICHLCKNVRAWWEPVQGGE